MTQFLPPLPAAKGRGRGGSSAFKGTFVVRYLEANGPSSPAAIHQKLSAFLSAAGTSAGRPWGKPTWRSFWVWFRMTAKLGLVRKLGEEEIAANSRLRELGDFVSDQRGSWDLTELGRTRPDLWQNVKENLYPTTPEQRREYARRARERASQRKRVAELAAAGQIEVNFNAGEPAFRVRP